MRTDHNSHFRAPLPPDHDAHYVAWLNQLPVRHYLAFYWRAFKKSDRRSPQAQRYDRVILRRYGCDHDPSPIFTRED